MSQDNGSFTLYLDVPREAKFTMNSLCRMEEDTGVSVADWGESMKAFTFLRDLIWYSLRSHEPTMTKEAFEMIIESISIEKAMAASKQVQKKLLEAMSELNPVTTDGIG